MKKTLAIAAATMLGGLLATPAMAQDAPPPPKAADTANDSGFYAGGGINLYFIDKNDAAEGLPISFIDQPSPGAFLGRLGYAFNQYFAIEVEAGFGGANSEFEGGGSTLEIGVASPLGAHLAATIPLGQGGGYLLAKGGYSSVTVERTLNGVDAPEIDISGTSFGVGGGFRNDSWDFRMEYSFLSGDASSGVLGMFAMSRF
jgi:Outer membrane protein beta-barrel domain